MRTEATVEEVKGPVTTKRKYGVTFFILLLAFFFFCKEYFAIAPKTNGWLIWVTFALTTQEAIGTNGQAKDWQGCRCPTHLSLSIN